MTVEAATSFITERKITEIAEGPNHINQILKSRLDDWWIFREQLPLRKLLGVFSKCLINIGFRLQDWFLQIIPYLC